MKSTLRRIATAIAVTLALAISAPAEAGNSYHGQYADPWKLQHPVGNGSILGDKFNREVFAGGVMEFQDYIQRHDLRAIVFTQDTEFNPYMLAAFDTGGWDDIYAEKIWAICMQTGAVDIDTVCVAAGNKGEPLDKRILDESYRREAANYLQGHYKYWLC